MARSDSIIALNLRKPLQTTAITKQGVSDFLAITQENRQEVSAQINSMDKNAPLYQGNYAKVVIDGYTYHVDMNRPRNSLDEASIKHAGMTNFDILLYDAILHQAETGLEYEFNETYGKAMQKEQDIQKILRIQRDQQQFKRELAQAGGEIITQMAFIKALIALKNADEQHMEFEDLTDKAKDTLEGNEPDLEELQQLTQHMRAAALLIFLRLQKSLKGRRKNRHLLI